MNNLTAQLNPINNLTAQLDPINNLTKNVNDIINALTIIKGLQEQIKELTQNNYNLEKELNTTKNKVTRLEQKVTPTPTTTNKLTLKKIKTLKKYAKKLVLKATLKGNAKAVKGKKVTFIFRGKKFKAKTNKKGVAKVTIKKRKLKKLLKKVKVGKKVVYRVKYGKKTVKRYVKIKK